MVILTDGLPQFFHAFLGAASKAEQLGIELCAGQPAQPLALGKGDRLQPEVGQGGAAVVVNGGQRIDQRAVQIKNTGPEHHTAEKSTKRISSISCSWMPNSLPISFSTAPIRSIAPMWYFLSRYILEAPWA